MLLSKIKNRFLKFNTHPLTKTNPYGALFRYLLFNITAKINNRPRIYNWINGLKFLAQRGDAGIVPNIYFKLFDYEDSRFILDNLGEKDVFIDVGANVGHFTMLAASKRCTVYAFEPVPSTYEKLIKNIELNNLKVCALNKGVGAEKGILNFSTQRGVMNSVVFDATIASLEIEVVKLDEALKSMEPSMIKINVEGFEWFVLQGAKDLLENKKLKYILIELNNSGIKFSIQDELIHKFLVDKGFYPHQYDFESKKLNQITDYRRDKFNTLYVRNHA